MFFDFLLWKILTHQYVCIYTTIFERHSLPSGDLSLTRGNVVCLFLFLPFQKSVLTRIDAYVRYTKCCFGINIHIISILVLLSCRV